jgi:hypothetical protein
VLILPANKRHAERIHILITRKFTVARQVELDTRHIACRLCRTLKRVEQALWQRGAPARSGWVINAAVLQDDFPFVGGRGRDFSNSSNCTTGDRLRAAV